MFTKGRQSPFVAFMRGNATAMPMSARGFLGRLARDVRGNTIALVAAALIPMAGMVGGGIDMSRLYITKTRLQHACDAGALAGRKAMGGGIWSHSSFAPRTAANSLFDANFPAGAYGSSGLSRTFTEANGKVTGTVSATVPMTLTRVIGKTTETLTVSCDAAMSLPNTDVMFVLDVTGSMGSKAVSTDTETKMEALQGAVKCFYESVAQRNTSETCTSGAPTGGVTAVQVRFGFVPYATNVNVGRLLPSTFFADTWNYQTRRANMRPPGTYVTGPYWEIYGSSISRSNCLKFMNNTSFNGFTPTAATSGGPSPATEVSIAFNSDGAATSGTDDGEWSWNGAPDTSGNSRSCRRRRTDTATTYVDTLRDWTYGSLPVDISGLKNGSGWNPSFTRPIGANASNVTLNWDGCIEERATVRAASYTPIPGGAKDLDIDLMPTAGDASSLWAPAIPGLIYTRNQTAGGGGWNLNEVTTTADYINASQYFCPTEAKKLVEWNDATAFESYVDSLTPSGNTYHDIGMIWGARLMSPTGIFASENALTPSGGEIERHMIFMTDGEACTGVGNYGPYGIGWFDRRQTDPSTAPTDGCNTTGTLTQQVNARLAGLCAAVKNKNITLWVIWFGVSNTTIETSLRACATTDRFYSARNSADLDTVFGSIASEISQLRLTR